MIRVECLLAASADNQGVRDGAYTCSSCCRSDLQKAMNHYGDLEPRTEQTVHYATGDIYDVSSNTEVLCQKCLLARAMHSR